MYIDEKQTTVGHTGSNAWGEQVRPLAADSMNRESPCFSCGECQINGIRAKSDEVPIFAKDVASKKILPSGVGGRIFKHRLIEFSVSTFN